jgi:putative tryptophan/tyrosine transport system substrate-binding protein
MKRRKFLGLVAGGIAWPVVGQAQQQTMPLIGFLSSRSPEDSKPHLAGFLRGLEALGYIDGKTARIEYRWAYGRYDQLRKLASELTALQPIVIAAAGGAPSARAAKSVTASIPITFVTSDSVSEGVVASLNQPGANITGVDLMSGELTGKRLELLSLSHQYQRCSEQLASEGFRTRGTRDGSRTADCRGQYGRGDR